MNHEDMIETSPIMKTSNIPPIPYKSDISPTSSSSSPCSTADTIPEFDIGADYYASDWKMSSVEQVLYYDDFNR